MLVGLAPGQSNEGGAGTLSGTCSIEAPATGGIVREPTGGTGTLGLALYRVQFEVTYSDGTVESIPDEEPQLLEVIPKAVP